MAKVPGHIEKIIFAAFVAAAVWYEFGPKADPASELITEAAVVTAQSAGAVLPGESCALYREALVRGSREGAWHFADCIGQSMKGSASDRRALQYAVLSLALDTQVGGVTGRQKRDALKATAEEIARADAIDVIGILKTNGLPDPTQIQP